jgi:enoyl-CoA hydratase/carnithine racemase
MINSLVKEVREIFGVIKDDMNIRAVVLSSAGRMFTAGLDR